MRRYDIVSGILLILSTIDFALTAPVLVQEKRQACVDVVHIPRDVVTALGKRGPGEEELEKLMEKYFKTSEKPAESSDAHASPISAPAPAPDHGSTSVVPAPAPNPASSTANPIPLMEPSFPVLESSLPWMESSSPLSAASSGLSDSEKSDSQEYEWLYALDDGSAFDKPPGFSLSGYPGYGLDHELTGAPAHAHAPEPNPKKRPLTGPDPDFNWDYWMNLEDPPPSRPAKSLKIEEPGQASEYQVVHPPSPSAGLPTDPEHEVARLPSTSAGLPTEPKHEVVTPPSANPGSESKNEPEPEVLDGPPPSPELTEAQLAAIYAAKGKAKMTRRISGTTRDVGNAAQRESHLMIGRLTALTRGI